MGKKGGIGYGSIKKPPLVSALVPQRALSLRQQTGRTGGGSASQVHNPAIQAAALRAEHLLRIATWASANAPPLGALFGSRLGCLCEAAGVPAPDTPHTICQRCESILQVGVNCSVRITKKKRKGKSRKTENVCNYVTHVCHFCKYGNTKPGTSKNHLKTKISQIAARANLEMLGKSLATETPSVDKKTSALDLTKSDQGSAKEEGSKYVQIIVEKGPPSVTEKNQLSGMEQEASDAMEKNQLGCIEQEGSADQENMQIIVEMGPLGVTEKNQLSGTDQEVLDVTEKSQPGVMEQEASDVMEKNQLGDMGKEVLDATEKNQLGGTEQENVQIVVEKEALDVPEKTQLSGTEQDGLDGTEKNQLGGMEKEASDVMEKNQLGGTEQEGSAEQENMQIIVEKGPLDVTKNQLGDTEPEEAAEQEDPKSVEASVTRKTLDLPKKKKKKNQQRSAEQEVPRPSLSKGPVAESSESSKKRKRKGWTTLKELAGIAQ